MCTASIWNTGLLLWNYMVLFSRRLSSSCLPLWAPEISRYFGMEKHLKQPWRDGNDVSDFQMWDDRLQCKVSCNSLTVYLMWLKRNIRTRISWGPHSDGSVGAILRYNAMWNCRKISTFRKSILPPSLWMTVEMACYFESLATTSMSTRLYAL